MQFVAYDSIQTCSFISHRLENTFEANLAGENSSLIFTVCVKSVPLYNFKLVHVVLQMAVKEFSEASSKNGEIGHFNV